MSESGVKFPAQGVKCADCGCCQANVFAGDAAICWACDEGKPCAGREAGARPQVTTRVEEPRAAGVAARAIEEAVLRVVGGEPVRMPAQATMGAEPLDGFIGERKTEREKESGMGVGKFGGATPEDVQRPIVVDPEQPGTASSLLDALKTIDGAAAAEKVQVELTLSEVAAIVGRMDVARRNAFIGAGLRAALLG